MGYMCVRTNEMNDRSTSEMISSLMKLRYCDSDAWFGRLLKRVRLVDSRGMLCVASTLLAFRLSRDVEISRCSVVYMYTCIFSNFRFTVLKYEAPLV